MKIKLLIFILVFLTIPIVSAVDELGTFQNYKTVSLLQTCDNCTSINITSIKYPNSTILYINSPMISNGSTYTYSFSSVDVIGEYIYTTCGNPNGVYVCESVLFNITPSGFTGTLGFYFLVISMSFVVMFLGFWIRDSWIVIFSTFGLYFVGVFILFYGIADIKDAIMTQGTAIITLGVAAYISIRAGIETIDGL